MTNIELTDLEARLPGGPFSSDDIAQLVAEVRKLREENRKLRLAWQEERDRVLHHEEQLRLAGALAGQILDARRNAPWATLDAVKGDADAQP